MAIQNRRGAYGDFDPSKLLPGEWAVVLSGDTNASDGLACYMCFKAGVVKRMATYEDMIDNIAATSGELIAEEVDRQCKEAIQECKAATNSANIAITNANSAAANAVSVAASAQAAADRANEAAGNIEQENIKPLAYSVSGESITAGNSAEKPLIGLTVHGRADQVSTTGAQLIDFEHAPTRSCVLVDASTGTYRCNMDNTSYSFLDLPESVFGKILSGKGKTLRFQCDTSKPGTVISIVIYGTREDGLDYQDAAGTPGSNYVEMVVSDQFTSVTRAVLRFNQTQGATTTDTTTIYSGLMLYFKESAVLPFEPYTGNAPSPSVEYPQAIDIAGSGRSINVKVVGANLFDISKVQSISGASGSQTTNNNDGTLLVQSSQGDSSGGYEDGKNVLRDLCPELRAGDIAVLSAKSTGSDKRIYLRGSKSPWTFGISRTISETDLDSIVMFYASGTSTSATISEIMINAGSVALPYEPYKTPQSVSLSTPNGLAGLKVSSGGNYTDASGQQWICDEIVRNERGTGKRIQRIGIIESYASETINTAYMSTTGQLTEGATVLYVLDDAIETNLSTEEIAALSALHTYYPTTTISNDAGCDMTAAYVTQYYQGVGDAMFYGVADNLTTEASGTSVMDAHQGKILKGLLDDIWKTIYPVGSIYMSVNNTDPGTLFGGTWEAWGTGRVPVGVDSGDSDFSTAGKTGGEKRHILSNGEIPSVTGSFYLHGSGDGSCIANPVGCFAGSDINTGHYREGGTSVAANSSAIYVRFNNGGEGQSHNNLQPYITCYMWKRTA